VQTTAKSFTVKEVSADKAYSGRECHDAIAAVGATPFIMFKDITTGGVGGLFAKMFHYFNYRRDEFLAHYHQRSNVESAVMMVKTKFGDGLKSKTDVAGRNEVLCKVPATIYVASSAPCMHLGFGRSSLNDGTLTPTRHQHEDRPPKLREHGTLKARPAGDRSKTPPVYRRETDYFGSSA